MGLAWQQGPLARGAIGTFLVAQPLPERLLFAEPLRRRMSARFAGETIAQSDEVILLHEPARYPVAYFPKPDVRSDVLEPSDHVTRHQELGPTAWYTVRLGDRQSPRGAWEHPSPPEFAPMFADRVAFAWHAMDAFHEETERIIGHAADPYHRIDIRQSARHLVVTAADLVVADTHRPLVLYESGFAPRWYVPREDVLAALPVAHQQQTFCPYKGLCSYYDFGDVKRSGWSYLEPYREVDRIAGCISFEPDRVEVRIDGEMLHAEPGQTVVAHGPDRGLTPDEVSRVHHTD
ncbi:MAG TPA: DUF427 domain-containing protein [Solirubrobacteraceae bacterium]